MPARLCTAASAVAALVLGAAPARAQVAEPRAPIMAELIVGGSLPHRTLQVGAGMHGWWRDAMPWGIRLVAANTPAEVDLDGDGRNDYDASDDGPHPELQLDVGVPLSWKLETGVARVGYRTRHVTPRGATAVGTVRQISLVSGARAAISGEPQVAVPLGLRWSRHRIIHERFQKRGYREHWVQARALWFLPANRPGFDLEALWMPRNTIGLMLYGEVIPALATAGVQECRNDRYRLCTPGYPVSAFNPIGENTYVQIGARARLVIDL